MLTAYNTMSTNYPTQHAIVQRQVDSFVPLPLQVSKRLREEAEDEEPASKRSRVRRVLLQPFCTTGLTFSMKDRHRSKEQ